MTTWKIELSATRTAAASRSPQARSFQMMTMAMQRARPTMIRPVRYSGRSGSSSQASANISAGPSTQFSTSELTQQLAVAGDGVEAVVADLGQHRVHHDQQAEGDRQRDAVDLDRVQRVVRARGSSRPSSRPATMATPIHTGRNRSRVESLRDVRRRASAGSRARCRSRAPHRCEGRAGSALGEREQAGQRRHRRRDHPVVDPGAAASRSPAARPRAAP